MIENIKIGIKIHLNEIGLFQQIREHQDIIDFVEILLPFDFKSKDLSVIKSLQIPYNIHLPHFTKGIDFGNKKQTKFNQEFIERVRTHEDLLQALSPSCYIVHPESGDLQLSISNLKQLIIAPLALENMPYRSLAGGTCLAYHPESILPFFEQVTGLEFCLDLNHAVKTAISKSYDSLELIENFLEIKKPIHFHLSDGNLTNELDEHLPLGKGQYNLSGIKNILLNIGSEVSLTFETPRKNKVSVQEDLVNMNYFIEI